MAGCSSPRQPLAVFRPKHTSSNGRSAVPDIVRAGDNQPCKPDLPFGKAACRYQRSMAASALPSRFVPLKAAPAALSLSGWFLLSPCAYFSEICELLPLCLQLKDSANAEEEMEWLVKVVAALEVRDGAAAVDYSLLSSTISLLDIYFTSLMHTHSPSSLFESVKRSLEVLNSQIREVRGYNLMVTKVHTIHHSFYFYYRCAQLRLTPRHTRARRSKISWCCCAPSWTCSNTRKRTNRPFNWTYYSASQNKFAIILIIALYLGGGWGLEIRHQYHLLCLFFWAPGPSKFL